MQSKRREPHKQSAASLDIHSVDTLSGIWQPAGQAQTPAEAVLPFPAGADCGCFVYCRLWNGPNQPENHGKNAQKTAVGYSVILL